MNLKNQTFKHLCEMRWWSSLGITRKKRVNGVPVVKAGIPAEQLSESEFKKILIGRVQAGGGTLFDRSITLGLPESSLTATLQNTLKQYPNTNIDASQDRKST